MKSITHAAQTQCHLSKHERQGQVRAEAFSRRSRTDSLAPSPVKLAPEDVKLIDRLVRGDRTAVSTRAGDRRDGAGEPDGRPYSPGSPRQHPGHRSRA